MVTVIVAIPTFAYIAIFTYIAYREWTGIGEKLMYKTTLKIDGMMCGMCEAHMNDLIRKNFTVKKVSSSAKKGETVIISENELDLSSAESAIKEIGYELKDTDSELYQKKGLFSFGKK